MGCSIAYRSLQKRKNFGANDWSVALGSFTSKTSSKVNLLSELAKIERKFTAEIKRLQENCKHENLTRWQSLYWAPGHATRFEVRFCKCCGKIIKQRTWCDQCHRPVSTEKMIKGNGETTPIGSFFCRRKCLTLYIETNKK